MKDRGGQRCAEPAIVAPETSKTAWTTPFVAGTIYFPDHRRGQLVGQRTYGKGIVQGVFRMQSAKVGLCLTTAKFYSPNRTPISDRGVTPTVIQAADQGYVAARPADDATALVATNVVLRKAVELARAAEPTVAGRAPWSK